MIPASVVRLFVENRAEVLMTEALFADLVHDRRIFVRMCWESSGAISLAELSLLQSPFQPVAVILNCSVEPREFRAPFERMLGRAAPSGGWHVALAIPDMTTWLLKDPRFAPSWADAKAAGRPTNKMEIAIHCKDWQSKGHQFDRELISSLDEEFAALDRFIASTVSSVAET